MNEGRPKPVDKKALAVTGLQRTVGFVERRRR